MKYRFTDDAQEWPLTRADNERQLTQQFLAWSFVVVVIAAAVVLVMTLAIVLAIKLATGAEAVDIRPFIGAKTDIARSENQLKILI